MGIGLFVASRRSSRGGGGEESSKALPYDTVASAPWSQKKGLVSFVECRRFFRFFRTSREPSTTTSANAEGVVWRKKWQYPPYRRASIISSAVTPKTATTAYGPHSVTHPSLDHERGDDIAPEAKGDGEGERSDGVVPPTSEGMAVGGGNGTTPVFFSSSSSTFVVMEDDETGGNAFSEEHGGSTYK